MQIANLHIDVEWRSRIIFLKLKELLENCSTPWLSVADGIYEGVVCIYSKQILYLWRVMGRTKMVSNSVREYSERYWHSNILITLKYIKLRLKNWQNLLLWRFFTCGFRSWQHDVICDCAANCSTPATEDTVKGLVPLMWSTFNPGVWGHVMELISDLCTWGVTQKDYTTDLIALQGRKQTSKLLNIIEFISRWDCNL